MRRVLAVVLVPVLVLAAEEKPGAKPNALTEMEVWQGWLLLFDGETTFGWKIDGEAKVEKGVLVLGGTKETRAEVTTHIHSYHVSFEAAWEGKKAPKCGFGSDKRMLALDEYPGLVGQTPQGKFGGPFSFVTAEPHPKNLPMMPETPICFYVPAGSKLMLRSVKVRPQGLERIFNEKDLTGCKK